MHEDLKLVWKNHNEGNLKVFQLAEGHEGLSARPRSRSVAKQLKHMIKVRQQWLKTIKPVQKLASLESEDLADIQTSMDVSSAAILNLIELEQSGVKITGAKSIMRFVSYLIAHESHHRGQILLTLKLNGVKINRNDQYALWKW